MLEFDNSSIKLPLNTQTAWKRKDGKGHYTLGSLWVALQSRSLRTGDYLRNAQKLKISIVEFNDREEVTKYFTDQVQETQWIDTAMRAQTLLRKDDLRSGRARPRDQKMDRKTQELTQKAAGHQPDHKLKGEEEKSEFKTTA